MRTTPIGILGVGCYMPEEVRRNDFWPRSAVEVWPKKMAAMLGKDERDFGFPITPGVRAMLNGFREFLDDSFFGITERRVMPQGMTSSQMEIRAAKEAITDSGVDPQEIGVVLTHSMVPDFHTYNQATPIHHALNLSPNCFCTGVDAVCNSFSAHMMVANDLLSAGRGKYALIVQSSGVSRYQKYDEWFSAFVGDGASAVVLGPVKEGKGLLSSSFRTESSSHLGLVTGVPGRAWYEDGRSVTYAIDKAATRRTVFTVNDYATEVIHEALQKAGLRSEDIDFFACHQTAGNLRKQVQELTGMQQAKFIDTLQWAGTISSANIPLQLSCAKREGMLQDGDLLLIFTMGAGMVAHASALRWGV